MIGIARIGSLLFFRITRMICLTQIAIRLLAEDLVYPTRRVGRHAKSADSGEDQAAKKACRCIEAAVSACEKRYATGPKHLQRGSQLTPAGSAGGLAEWPLPVDPCGKRPLWRCTCLPGRWTRIITTQEIRASPCCLEVPSRRDPPAYQFRDRPGRYLRRRVRRRRRIRRPWRLGLAVVHRRPRLCGGVPPPNRWLRRCPPSM